MSQLNVIHPVFDRVRLPWRFKLPLEMVRIEWIYIGVPHHEAVVYNRRRIRDYQERDPTKRDAYWAKTCFSLKFCDGFFLPKSEPNMVVAGEATLGT
jgi:hypothetical protein